MICRKKKYQTGDLVTVVNYVGTARLPGEIPNGSTVKVSGKDAGQVQIVFLENQFTVAEACVISGWEYLFKGKWRDENDPLILATFKREKPGIQAGGAN